MKWRLWGYFSSCYFQLLTNTFLAMDKIYFVFLCIRFTTSYWGWKLSIFTPSIWRSRKIKECDRDRGRGRNRKEMLKVRPLLFAFKKIQFSSQTTPIWSSKDSIVPALLTISLTITSMDLRADRLYDWIVVVLCHACGYAKIPKSTHAYRKYIILFDIHKYSTTQNNWVKTSNVCRFIPYSLTTVNRANKFTFRNPHWILQKASVFEKCLEKCSDERMCAKVSRICLAHICIAYDIITVFGNQPPVPRWLNDINILLTVVGNCADSIYNCTSFPRHFIVHKNANNYKNYHTERELSYNSL